MSAEHRSLVDEVVDNYRPKCLTARQWEAVKEPTRAALLRSGAAKRSSLTHRRRHVAELLVWADSQGFDLEDPELFGPTTVEAYLGSTRRSTDQLRFVRSALKQAAPAELWADDRHLIDRYEPFSVDTEMWEHIGPVVRSAARRCVRISDETLGKYLGYATAFVAFLVDDGVDVTAGEVFTDELIEGYVEAALGDHHPSYRQAIRSGLRHLRPDRDPDELGQHDPERIAQLIATFTPRKVESKVWEQVGPLAVEATEASAPKSCEMARALLSDLGVYLQWCLEQPGMPLKAEVVFSEAAISRYVATALNDRADHSQAAVRSRLRNAGRAHARGAIAPRGQVLRGEQLSEPYTEREMIGFLRSCDVQSTAIKRRKLAAHLCLSAGAGLLAKQAKWVAGTDVKLVDGMCIVKLRDGHRVAVLERFADRLMATALEAGDRLLMGGRKPDRLGSANLLQDINLPPDLPPLDVRRLRATWLVEQLQAGTRIELILEQLQLFSTRSIEGYLGFVPLPDRHEALAALAAPGRREVA